MTKGRFCHSFKATKWRGPTDSQGPHGSSLSVHLINIGQSTCKSVRCNFVAKFVSEFRSFCASAGDLCSCVRCKGELATLTFFTLNDCRMYPVTPSLRSRWLVLHWTDGLLLMHQGVCPIRNNVQLIKFLVVDREYVQEPCVGLSLLRYLCLWRRLRYAQNQR